jgi:hypothetical protein
MSISMAPVFFARNADPHQYSKIITMKKPLGPPTLHILVPLFSKEPHQFMYSEENAVSRIGGVML